MSSQLVFPVDLSSTLESATEVLKLNAFVYHISSTKFPLVTLEASTCYITPAVVILDMKAKKTYRGIEYTQSIVNVMNYQFPYCTIVVLTHQMIRPHAFGVCSDKTSK